MYVKVIVLLPHPVSLFSLNSSQKFVAVNVSSAIIQVTTIGHTPVKASSSGIIKQEWLQEKGVIC